jgi:RHS repeat-associated protein
MTIDGDEFGDATTRRTDCGGLNRTTNFTYTLDNLIATMTAVNPATGNQTTTWTYGTTLADSGVARNDLLRHVQYPDIGGWAGLSVGDWAQLGVDDWSALPAGAGDLVAYAYNRLGQQTGITDQRGTVRTFYYDLLGRLTNDCVTTVGSNTDDAVLRISRAYEIRGMVSAITSFDSATPGSGTVLNQVQFTFNSFGQLTFDAQSHGGNVTMSTPGVGYAYDTGGSSSNEIRLNQLTYPNGRTISYSFGTTGGMSDYLNRVDAINDTSSGTTTLASYTYLGAGTVIRITHPEPNVWLGLWGGTSGTFSGLDQFNRVIDQRWQNNITGTPTDIDRYQYGYDQNSNRLYKANVVGTAAVTAGLDEFYTYDPLNRLTEMQRGVLNSGKTGITGTPSVEQDWTLDATGNWANFITKSSGTTTLNQARTANPVNEITNITESTGPTWVVPAYDAAGNTITMPKPASPTASFTAVHDAWNRMVRISSGSTPVGQYQYDGRNFRIVKLTYTSGVLSETRDFYFTANWRDVDEHVGGTMVDQYVWGVRYIDELVCRDDDTPRRLYAIQDANFNLTGITDVSGAVVERYLYDPYGDRTITNAAWTIISATAYAWCVVQQGLMTDQESTLICNRLRIYSSVVAFLQRDFFEYVYGTNLYQLGQLAPVNYTDPYGPGAGPNRPKFEPLAVGFKLCQRDIRATGDSWDRFLASVGNALAGGHEYVATPNDVDASGAPIDGWEIFHRSKGQPPQPAVVQPGEVVTCAPCFRSDGGVLKYGKGSGKTGAQASDDEIKSCIRNRPMPRDYNVVLYNCQDWASGAGQDCGLDCDSPRTS